MGPIRVAPGGSRKPGNGGPSVYGGIGRSPMKVKKSPFKTKRPSVAKGDSRANNEDASEGVSANIRVAVRVRPENERELGGAFRNVIEVIDDRMLVFDPENNGDDFFYHGKKVGRRDLNKKAARDKKFAFDAVFGPNSSNQDVFEHTTKDLIDVIFNGYNCSVFVYGATGAGKTHTMLGSANNPGITFRTVKELYERIESIKEESTVEIAVSYLEVYNETIIDLINPESGQLAMRDDEKSTINIPGLSMHRPNSPEDLLRLLQCGNSNRRQHPTDANKESSRSHAVFQVYVKQTSLNSGTSSDIKVAKLSMIDLAGSEKGSATGNKGARFREGANINKSLLALGNCINALAEGSKYIPYRNSKLTRLLKDSIGGNCRTVMISNISPSSMTFEDTFNTLKYADRAKKIKINLKKNVLSVNHHVGQYVKIVEDLNKELRQLKQKVYTLELENEGLKDQVEAKENYCTQQKDCNDENTLELVKNELESAKLQLISMKEKQKHYDDLEKRLADYENRDVIKDAVSGSKNISMATANTAIIQVSEANQDDLMDNCADPSNLVSDVYRDLMHTLFTETSKLKVMKIKRDNHNKRFERFSTICLQNPKAEDQMEKLNKFVKSQDKNIARSEILCAQLLSEMDKQMKKENDSLQGKTYEKSLVEEFNHRRSEIESAYDNAHFEKVLQVLVLEANQNDSILKESLKQLRKSHLILRQQGELSEETKQDFDNLVSRIQCNKLQFRDALLVETNQDELKDRVGDFYTSCSNLTIALPNYDYACNEENNDDVDSKSEDRASSSSNIGIAQTTKHNYIPTENIDKDVMRAVNSDDQEDEHMTPEVWRPPTPPKVSPVQKEAKQSLVSKDMYNIAPEQINMSLEKSVSKTPSPPQLTSVDISSWRGKDIRIDNTDTNEISNCKLSSPHSESVITAERNLDTTFDMSDITANPNVVSTIRDAETMVLEDCEYQKIDSGQCYIQGSDYLHKNENENISPMPECDSLSVNDATVVLEEHSQIQLFENLLTAKDNQPSGFDSTKEKLKLTEDTTPIVYENSIVTKEPNDISRHQILHEGNSVISNSSLENVVVNDENTISTNNTISKEQKSNRRGTFTLGKVELQNNSPNIAIVPPNTRQALMTPVQEDKVSEVEAQSQNTTCNLISSSISIQQRQNQTSSNSLDVETATSVASRTPPKLDPIEVPLSASTSKRTLKRTGQHNLSGVTSASTSKLLKGINAYRHPLKERLPAVNIISNSNPLQAHQIKNNAPSYMAATASSSRKLNFSTSTEHVLTKSNHNSVVVVKQTPSTSPRKDETINEGTYKENERYKGQLQHRPKDLEWSGKKLTKGFSTSALRQHNK